MIVPLTLFTITGLMTASDVPHPAQGQKCVSLKGSKWVLERGSKGCNPVNAAHVTFKNDGEVEIHWKILQKGVPFEATSLRKYSVDSCLAQGDCVQLDDVITLKIQGDNLRVEIKEVPSNLLFMGELRLAPGDMVIILRQELK
jgi:hypothetical protein